jgi:aminopeptidase N
LRASRAKLPLLALAVAILLAAPASAGERGSEPFFPYAGNSGYDADSYHVNLAFRPSSGRIRAVTTIRAQATQGLRRFGLDFVGPRVSRILVDGQPAAFQRTASKLRIDPPRRIPPGARFTVLVRYAGVPPRVTDPDGSQEGWYRTEDGAFGVGEPQGTAAWIPCDNVPYDKASFRFDLSVPTGLRAVANGRLTGVERGGGRSHYSWVETAPMSTYLAVVDIGRGRLVKSRAGKLPAWTLVDPRLARGSRGPLAQLPEIIDFERRAFGAYPFATAGSIVDWAPKLGYALETQSRPIYPYVPDVTTIVHETAHQWFGDSVGLKRWPEIWLNEGFATWMQWYYAEHHGGRTAHAIFDRLYRVPAADTEFWDPPPARPGSPRHLFGTSTYVRGAMAIEALRQAIGTGPLLRVFRTWVLEHRHGSGDIPEFISLCEEVSGRNLGPLFRRWLYQRGKPRR